MRIPAKAELSGSELLNARIAALKFVPFGMTESTVEPLVVLDWKPKRLLIVALLISARNLCAVPVTTIEPVSLTTNLVAPVESLVTRMAGSRSTEVSLAVSVVASSTVKLVLEAIAVMVLVSPDTVILSPTVSSWVKSVPDPVSVVDAVGLMLPVITVDDLPRKLVVLPNDQRPKNLLVESNPAKPALDGIVGLSPIG
jgi:hypothetical protein